jgi:sugar lactone lactonase YvrE
LVLTAAFAVPLSAHPGWGIIVDPHHNTYFTDLKQVWRISAGGEKRVVVPHVHTHELYLDPGGTLFGEHLWYDNRRQKWGHYLWELTPDGRVIRHAPQEGFRTEVSFVRDADGRMYWMEGSRLLTRKPGGPPETRADLGADPAAPGRVPGGILAAAPDGTTYVVSTGVLLRIAPDGSSARVASGLNEHVWSAFLTQPWHYVMGLAVDPQGNVYVANAGARKLKKVTPSGKVATVLSAGFPWSPCGVAVHGADVYVLEFADWGSAVRVRKISADGRITKVK